jgi:hypothetical protein
MRTLSAKGSFELLKSKVKLGVFLSIPERKNHLLFRESEMKYSPGDGEHK